MNRNFKSPQNQNDHMSNEDDGNKSRSANRHRFRAFFLSSDGSWEIKESVQKGYLRDITGISEIVINRNSNLCDSPFVNQNIMNETNNYHKKGTSRIEQVVNKLKQTDKFLSISSTPDSYVNFSPREKKGVSGSFKGKEHSEINPSKTSPDKSVTKFSFKDFTPEFDPSQDIFESSIRNEHEYGEFSSETKGEKSQKTINDPENTFRKEVNMRLKNKKRNRRKNTRKEARKFNNIKLNYVENMNKDKLYHPPQKRKNVEDTAAENLSMLEELFLSQRTDETIVEAVEHMEAKLKSNTCSQEKKPLSKKSEHTTNSNCNLANTITAFNLDGSMTVSKEIEVKMYGKDSNAGDLNFKIRKDQVAKIESTNEKKQNSSSNTIDNEGEIDLFEKSQEQRKRKKTMSTSVNSKLKTNRMISIGNSNKHKINLKTNYGQQMKGNVWVESIKKQTHIITTNTPSEVDESQKQKDEKNTCNTNPNITLGKDYINCKVTKSHRKETSKNNTKNIKVDYSPGKFPYETDLKVEENTSPRKKKKHNRNKLKNSITGVEKHLTEKVQDGNDISIENILTNLKTSENVAPRKRKIHSRDKEQNNTGIDVGEKSCEESQNGNDISIANLLTDLKTSENVTPRKRKQHSQDKEESNTGLHVDEQSCEESQIGNDIHIENVLTNLKTSENVAPRKRKIHSRDKEQNNTGIDVGEKSCEESQNGNDISIENLLTDLKTSENVTPRKRKQHSQDKEESNTGLHVDEQSCEESQIGNDIHIENVLTNLKTSENVAPRKRKIHSRDNEQNNTGIDVGEKLCEESQNGNDISIANLLTDLKTSENVTPRKKKQHSQDKEESNTGLHVDEQSCEESQIGNDIHIENVLTNLKTSENVAPRKRKIHSRDKEQNNTGIDVGEKSCEESQNGNDISIANLLTDLKTNENVTPSKIKEHSQYEEGNNTAIDVDKQSCEESQVGNDIHIENVLTDLKSCEDVTPRKRKRHSQNNEKNNTGIDVDEKSCKESQDMFGDDEPNYDIHSSMKEDYVSISFHKEVPEKKDKKDVGDLNPEMRIDQVTQIKSTKIKKQNSNSNINGNVGEKMSTNANTKFEKDRIISFENSNKHEMKLKTNSSQEMKGNSQIDMSEKKTDVTTTNTPKKQSDVITSDTPEKQTDVTARNTLTENDESQEQIDEKNTCNTNLNIQLGKDYISCKVSKRHSKEISKNNVRDFKGDSLTGKFLYETDITAEEHPSPRKRKKHKNKLKNNSTGEGEHLSVEVQDGNDTYVDNLITDFKTRDNFKPRKGKKHCQDKSKDNTGIDVDGQSVCNEVQTMFGNDCVRPKKIKEHKNNKLENNISIDSLSNKYKTGRESRPENPGDFSSNSSNFNEDLYNSETELSSNLSITSAKKLKKHKKEIAKTLNFDRKSSLYYPDAKKDASSSKKHKKSDELSPKGYSRKHNKPCPGSALVSDEQENSDTNDSECKCADESCTGSTSSSENEANKKICKKLITKSKAHSKEQSDILNENKALLVSSTPFPVRKKGKKRFSELGENSSRSFYNTRENINNDNSTPANQTILEEIQCKMIASESEMKSLKKLKIEVDWELSPLHKIDTGSGKVNASKLRKKLGSKHLQLLDESKLTEEDENKIKQSWEEFAQMYNFSNPELFFPSAQNFGCFSYAERHNFKLFLAKYLPNRRLLSVYLKFVNMYGVKKKGRWSDKEDRLLLDLYNACTGDNSSDGDSKEESQRQPKLGLPMKKIMSKALDRKMTSVIARLNILLQNENAKSLSQKDIDWTPEREGAVIHRLLKKSKVDSLEDLRHATISYEVWRKVVTKLGLPFDKVINHWKYVLYPQLFAHQPVLRHLLQMELIKWFYKSDIKDLKSVDWNDVSRRSGDLGSCYVFKVFNSLIHNYVPKNFRKNFRESVIFLHEHCLPKLKEKTTSHMLIRKFYDPHTRTLNYVTEDEEDCIPFRIE